jgi:hypothetical protein
MFVMFVTQLGTQGFYWVTQYDPKPILGPRSGPKTQPSFGLGWVGSGSNWVVEKSSSAIRPKMPNFNPLYHNNHASNQNSDKRNRIASVYYTSL